MLRCVNCNANNADTMNYCGNCGSSLDPSVGGGQRVGPTGLSSTEAIWEPAIAGERAFRPTFLRIGASEAQSSFQLAKIVLIIGMVIYLIGYVLAIVATEKLESADYSDFETITDMAKWSGYLEGAGLLGLFAGTVGVATGLAQANRNQ